MVFQFPKMRVIKAPQDCVDWFSPLKLLTYERFGALMLSEKYEVIGIKFFDTTGNDPSKCSFKQREVLKELLINDCAAVVFGHNHPNGNLTPSDEDLECIKRLSLGCRQVGICPLDSIIVTDSGYYSWLESGINIQEKE